VSGAAGTALHDSVKLRANCTTLCAAHCAYSGLKRVLTASSYVQGHTVLALPALWTSQ
jgi:hypothetical protein